jgi:hypothetical protein
VETIQFATVTPSGYATARNRDDLRHYFEHSNDGVELEERLPVIHFGEYLVEQGLIDRFQLFRALQLQDRTPGVQLGTAVAALGYAPERAVEWHHTRFQGLDTIDVD